MFASALMSDTAAKLRQLVGAMLSVGALLWLTATGILFTDNMAQLVGLPGLFPDALLWVGNTAVTLLVGILTPVLASRLILWRYAKRDISLTMKEG